MSVSREMPRATETATMPAEHAGWVRARLERIAPELRGFALLPLVVLFLLNFVDEFDQYAFGVLIPEIQRDFGLSDAGVGVIRALAGGLVWLAAPAVGFLGDRYSRVRISSAGATR